MADVSGLTDAQVATLLANGADNILPIVRRIMKAGTVLTFVYPDANSPVQGVRVSVLSGGAHAEARVSDISGPPGPSNVMTNTQALQLGALFDRIVAFLLVP